MLGTSKPKPGAKIDRSQVLAEADRLRVKGKYAPRALASLYEWIRTANAGDGGSAVELRAMLEPLALENLLAEASAPPAVVELAQQRVAARAAKDFAESDRLRDAIAAAGWVVRDGPDGYELTPAG